MVTTKAKVLVASCLMYFRFDMDRVNISSLAPMIGKELELSTFDIGLMFSAFAWSLAFSTSIAVLVFGLVATIMVGTGMGPGRLGRVEIVGT